MEVYRQCTLVQGATHQVAWIPERGAKKGLMVELKDGSGWWRVESVAGRATQQQALGYEDAHRRQRQASDI